MKRIFIVEDDKNISTIIAFNIKAAGFVCSCDAVFSQREAGFSQFVSQIFRRPDFDEALCRLG